MPRFSTVSWFAFSICLALAALWSCAPEILLGLWHVEATQSVIVVGHRSAALFLGFALLTYAMRRAPPSPLRTSVADALALACMALALLGLAELLQGHVGIGILSAVVVEVTLAVALPVSARIG